MAGLLTIATRRLVLRDFTMDDASAVHHYGSDPEVVRYMPWGPNTWTDTQDFLRGRLDDQRAVPRRSFGLAATLASSGELIGASGIRVTSARLREASMGYVYRRDVWNRGYASEAAKALVAFGFEQLGLHRVYAYCDVENIASVRVLQKTGMQREGLLRRHMPIRGRWRDSYLYAVLDEDWEAEQDCDGGWSGVT